MVEWVGEGDVEVVVWFRGFVDLKYWWLEVLVTYANLFHDGIVTTRRQLDRPSEWDVEEDDSTVSSLPSPPSFPTPPFPPSLLLPLSLSPSPTLPLSFSLLLLSSFYSSPYIVYLTDGFNLFISLGGRMYQQRVVTAGIVVVLILLILLILWIKFFR